MVAGCGEVSKRLPGDQTPDQAQTNNTDTADTDPARTENAGNCANEYYPLDTANDRNYRMTGSSSGTYSLRQDLADGDEFKEVRVFDSDITVTNNWVCTDEGLRMVEYTNYITMKEGAFDMETLKSSGVTLPRDWKTGTEWESIYDIRANMKVANMSTSANGKITITHRIVSLDDKVTAGGTDYSAARIDSLMSMDLTVKGVKVPDPKVSTANWYAKGVGLVRQEVGGGLGKQTVEYTGRDAR